MAEKSINVVTLLGRLGRDAETRFTPAGQAVTNFSIATTRAWKDKDDQPHEETDWHNCVLWRAEKLATFLTKGSRIHVTGRLQTRKYEKDGVTHYSTEVVVSDVVLLGEGKGQSSTPAPAAAPKSDGQGTVLDDDVPF